MPFSTRLPRATTAAASTSTVCSSNDNTKLGHKYYGEMMACGKSTKSGAGHHQPLIRGAPGK